MKEWLRDLYIEGREGFMIMGLVAGALFAAWLLGSIVSVVLEGDPATRARCKSLQGGAIADMKDCTIDHILPISKGGLSTLENCRLAHKHCNAKRGANND